MKLLITLTLLAICFAHPDDSDVWDQINRDRAFLSAFNGHIQGNSSMVLDTFCMSGKYHDRKLDYIDHFYSLLHAPWRLSLIKDMWDDQVYMWGNLWTKCGLRESYHYAFSHCQHCNPFTMLPPFFRDFKTLTSLMWEAVKEFREKSETSFGIMGGHLAHALRLLMVF